jgi:hypothetical protein
MGIKWPECGIGLLVLRLMGRAIPLLTLCDFIAYYRVNFNILLLFYFCVVLFLHYSILPLYFTAWTVMDPFRTTSSILVLLLCFSTAPLFILFCPYILFYEFVYYYYYYYTFFGSSLFCYTPPFSLYIHISATAHGPGICFSFHTAELII